MFKKSLTSIVLFTWHINERIISYYFSKHYILPFYFSFSSTSVLFVLKLSITVKLSKGFWLKPLPKAHWNKNIYWQASSRIVRKENQPPTAFSYCSNPKPKDNSKYPAVLYKPQIPRDSLGWQKLLFVTVWHPNTASSKHRASNHSIKLFSFCSTCKLAVW